MKWLVAAFLLAVSLVFGASSPDFGVPWPFDQHSLIQPVHYLFGGNPLSAGRRSWRL